MKIDSEFVQAPMLLFTPGYGTVLFMSDKTDYLTNKLSLKKGSLVGNLIVDSAGTLFKTVSAKKTRNVYPVWKFEFFNPIIYVELEVVKVSDLISLTELKDKVLKIIKREKNEWINHGDVKKIRKAVGESLTHQALIDAIGAFLGPL